MALGKDSAAWLLHRASDIWLIIDECSSAAAEAYRVAVEEQACRDAAARRVMLTTLLDGTAGNSSRAWEAMRVLRLDRKGPFLVVCGEINDGVGPLPTVEGQLRAIDIDGEWIHRAGSLLGLLALPNEQLVVAVEERLDGIALSRVGIEAGPSPRSWTRRMLDGRPNWRPSACHPGPPARTSTGARR